MRFPSTSRIHFCCFKPRNELAFVTVFGPSRILFGTLPNAASLFSTGFCKPEKASKEFSFNRNTRCLGRSTSLVVKVLGAP